ncbi:DUF2971 domain-containing protein [Acinetobacter baumannii]|uniref:DUF2971 domain-containing protein n=1 Tax=Acinetobacter baumannii TaxID=470 RepID=UPI0038B44949
MDFTKFADLILSKELYLRRIDSFFDPYEGIHSEITKARLTHFLSGLYSDDPSIDVSAMVENQVRLWRISKLESFVNCWHINEFESAGMWDLYAKTEEAVAIKTNIRKLKLCLENACRPDPHSTIYIDKVFYIDYENEAPISRHNNLGFVEHLFNKRKSFEHEKEFRILYGSYELYDWDEDTGRGTLNEERISERFKSNDEIHKSRSLTIDLKELITEVYVSPTAPKWFYEMTKKFMKSMGLEEIPCIQSSLYSLK